jgi:hypothetical protein
VEPGGISMSSDLETVYFDLTMKVVNYALEFVNQPGYAFLRITDLLDSLLSLVPMINEIDKKDFYKNIKIKLKDRRNLSTPEERTAVLNDILSIYIEEWRGK